MGRSLVSAFVLDKECEVVGFSRSVVSYPAQNFKWQKFDVFETPFKDLKLANFDNIYYCAGAGIQQGINESPDYIYQLNCFIPIGLVEYLRGISYTGSIVTFGSYFEIGNNSEITSFSEEQLIASQLSVPSDYCRSKRLLSRYASGNVAGIHHFHFILPTIYGSGENENRLFPYIVDSIKNNKALQFTSGEQFRQYAFVNDLGIFFTIANLANSKGGIYNFPCKEQSSIKDLVTIILSHFNIISTGLFGSGQRTDISMKYLSLECKKFEQMFNWVPRTTVAEVIDLY